MARTMKCLAALCVAASLGWAATAAAQTPVATWSFNNTLGANEVGVPALGAIDPLGLNGFVTDTVFGVTQTVYKYDGNSFPPSEQAGLYLNTTGLLNNDDAYSVDIVFKIDASQSSWKSIFGVSNRTSDNAFYVEPGDKLQVYPVGDGPTTFTFGEYHHVTLTNDGADHLTSYLDGIYQFNLTSTVMNFSTYAAANPDRLIHFFADNLIAGGQGEFSDGHVARIRLYDTVLSDSEVSTIAAIPEPETYAMMLAGLGLMAVAVRRRRQAASS